MGRTGGEATKLDNALVIELKRLWDAAGRPSSRNLSERSGISHTTVAAILNGRSIPREPHVDALVDALGGDSEDKAKARLLRAQVHGETRARAEVDGDEEIIKHYRRYALDRYQHGVQQGRRYEAIAPYVSPTIVEQVPLPAEPRAMSPEDFVRQVGRAFVLGAPGAGKTSLARYLVRYLAERDGDVAFVSQARDLGPQNGRPPLITEMIEQDLRLALQDSPPEGLVQRMLNRKKTLVIIDGLDEIGSDEGSTKVVANIEAFARRYPLTRIVITSRPAEAKQVGLDFPRFTLEEFNDDQVATFVRQWYESVPDFADRKGETTGNLLQRIAADVSATYRNPLLLGITCKIVLYRGSVPRNSSELFRLYWEERVSKAATATMTQDPEAVDWHDVAALGDVALAVVQGEKNGPEGYVFPHRAFAEHLAIRHLADESETPEELAIKYADLELPEETADLAEHVADTHWASGGYRLKEALHALSPEPVLMQPVSDYSQKGKDVLQGDDPVDLAGDLLNRGHIALRWANIIADVEPGSSIVFAINGPWGSGKTSILAMIEEHLARAGRQVLRFNPWLFSGTDQLMGNFFGELSAQLDVSDAKSLKIASSMRRYGALFASLKIVPLIGTSLAGAAEATSALGKYMEERHSRSIEDYRRDLEDALRELDTPITVFLDDIDRLTGIEIREILRMVRLTASLPNLVYVLAFDRHRVELALSEDGVSGRAYLEKIVQVSFDVPLPENESLRAILFAALDELISGGEKVRFTSALWPDVFIEIIEPLISNIRDVRRFIAPLRSTLGVLGDQVELVDVLALEAVRIFMPDSFAALQDAVEALTTPRMDNGAPSPEFAEVLNKFIASNPGNEEQLKSVCRRLFPASLVHLGDRTFYGRDSALAWLKERRVANGTILKYYLTKFLPEDLDCLQLAEEALVLFQDQVALRAFFDNLEPKKVEGVVGALESLEDNFQQIDPAPAIIVLLDQLKRLQRRTRGFFDFGPRLVVARVVLRLLRSVEIVSDRVQVVETSLDQLQTAGAKYELLRTVERKEDPDNQLIPKDDLLTFMTRVRNEIRSTTPDDLAKDADLLRLLWWAGEAEAEGPREWVVDPDSLTNESFAVEILKSAISTTRTQMITSRFVHHTDVLAWEPLSIVLGGEDNIRLCRDSAAAALGEEDELVSLVDKYLTGWRPSDFGDQ
jgi:Cdc6-like AAA superfamily ATPase